MRRHLIFSSPLSWAIGVAKQSGSRREVAPAERPTSQIVNE